MILSVIALADRYFLLIHKALALYLPAPLMNRLEKRSYVLKNPTSLRIMGGAFEIHHCISHTFSPENLTEYLTPKTAIIFPEDMMLTVFLSGYQHREDILTLKNEATATKRSQAWIDTYE
jgi:hypothetical protein